MFKSDSIQKAKWYKKAEGTNYCIDIWNHRADKHDKAVNQLVVRKSPSEIYENYDRKAQSRWPVNQLILAIQCDIYECYDREYFRLATEISRNIMTIPINSKIQRIRTQGIV